MGNWSIYNLNEPRDATGKWTKGAGSHAGGKHLARNQRRRAKEKARRGTPEQRAHLAAEIKHARSQVKSKAARSKIAQRAREHKAEREGREAPEPRKRGAGAKMVRAERRAKAKAATRGESLASHLEAGHRVSIRTKAGNIGHLRATKTESGKYEVTVHHERTGRQIHSLGEHTGAQLRARLTEHGGYARRLDLPKTSESAPKPAVSALPPSPHASETLRDTEVKLNRARLAAANPNNTPFQRDRADRRAKAEDLMARVTKERQRLKDEAAKPKPSTEERITATYHEVKPAALTAPTAHLQAAEHHAQAAEHHARAAEHIERLSKTPDPTHKHQFKTDESLSQHVSTGFDAAHSVHGDLGLPAVEVRALSRKSKDHGGYLHDKFRAHAIEIHPDVKHPAFAAVHEHGHLVDHQGLGTQGYGFASEDGGAEKVMKAIHASKETKELLRVAKTAKGPVGAHVKYLADPKEMFARAYSQHVATKTKHPDLMAGLEADRKSNFGKMAHWSDESFAPISREFDALFASRKS